MFSQKGIGQINWHDTENKKKYVCVEVLCFFPVWNCRTDNFLISCTRFCFRGGFTSVQYQLRINVTYFGCQTNPHCFCGTVKTSWRDLSLRERAPRELTAGSNGFKILIKLYQRCFFLSCRVSFCLTNAILQSLPYCTLNSSGTVQCECWKCTNHKWYPVIWTSRRLMIRPPSEKCDDRPKWRREKNPTHYHHCCFKATVFCFRFDQF